MAANVPLWKATEAIGHDGPTTTRELVNVLRSFGLDCADRLRRISRRRPVMPPKCLLSISYRPPIDCPKKSKSHWMYCEKGTIYDPAGAWPDFYKDWVITSYLEIY